MRFPNYVLKPYSTVVYLINVFLAYGGWGDLRDRRLCMMGFDGFEGPEAFL